MKKTNVMRILDKEKIPYEESSYDPDESVSAIDCANKLGVDPEIVYKTLVTESKDGNFVFVIPGRETLDLKKAARASGAKKIEMLKAKDLFPLTGYIHGGCSPIGMKKLFKTYIHIDAKNLEKFYISAGHVGYQVCVNPLDIKNLIGAEFFDLVKE